MYITVPSVYTKLTRTKLMTTASVHVAQLVIERCSGDPEVAGSIPSPRPWIYNDTHIYREKWESRPSYWFLSRESFTVYSSKILNSIVYSKLAVTCTRILANSIYISIRQGLADVQYEIVQAFPLQMSSHFDFLVGMVTLTLWLLDWSQNWPNCYFTLSNTVPDDFHSSRDSLWDSKG